MRTSISERSHSAFELGLALLLTLKALELQAILAFELALLLESLALFLLLPAGLLACLELLAYLLLALLLTALLLLALLCRTLSSKLFRFGCLPCSFRLSTVAPAHVRSQGGVNNVRTTYPAVCKPKWAMMVASCCLARLGSGGSSGLSAAARLARLAALGSLGGFSLGTLGALGGLGGFGGLGGLGSLAGLVDGACCCGGGTE